jgi:hypothetical protein
MYLIGCDVVNNDLAGSRSIIKFLFLDGALVVLRFFTRYWLKWLLRGFACRTLTDSRVLEGHPTIHK